MGKGSKLRIITAAVIVALALLMMFTGGVSAKFTNKALELRAGLFDSETIEYADIVSAELRTDLDLGSRSFGASNVFLDSGTFKNDEFGSYKIFADKKVKTYVVIRH